MTDTKFTPGPWRACEDQDDIEIVVPREKHIRYGVEGEWKLATLDAFEWDVDGDEVAQNELKANAHLIAASPDLYEALKDLRACIMETRGPCSHVAVIAADAAIAKAEGQS